MKKKAESKANPRWKSGKRKKYQQRFKAMGLPCAICGGRLGEIDYSTSDPKAPLGFVIDEKIPISKWKEAGYNSASECADDFNNLQPAHRICNARKGNKINFKIMGTPARTTTTPQPKQRKKIFLDGQW